MRSIAPAGVRACLLAASLATPASAVDMESLGGTWRGERNGVECLWQIDSTGRLRIDGRGANWTLHGDTLVVQFDPLEDSRSVGECLPTGERAVYQIQASQPGRGRRSLFASGFDLGTQGLFLVREEPAPEPVPMSEMAQAPVPPLPSRADVGPAAPAPDPTPVPIPPTASHADRTEPKHP